MIQQKILEDDTLKVVKAGTLPVGWNWHQWKDGSGSLNSPDGRKLFSYDLQTHEVQNGFVCETKFHGRNWSYLDPYIRFDEFKTEAEQWVLDNVISKPQLNESAGTELSLDETTIIKNTGCMGSEYAFYELNLPIEKAKVLVTGFTHIFREDESTYIEQYIESNGYILKPIEISDEEDEPIWQLEYDVDCNTVFVNTSSYSNEDLDAMKVVVLVDVHTIDGHSKRVAYFEVAIKQYDEMMKKLDIGVMSLCTSYHEKLVEEHMVEEVGCKWLFSKGEDGEVLHPNQKAEQSENQCVRRRGR